MRSTIVKWLTRIFATGVSTGPRPDALADRQRGVALTILMVLLGLFLFGMAGLGLDLGRLWLVRNQIQNAADAAALAGATGLMLESSGISPISRARARAANTADENAYGITKRRLALDGSTPNDAITFSDRSNGGWSPAPAPGPMNRFVKVVITTAKQPSGPVPLFFGRLIGISQVDVAANAVAGFSNLRIVAVPPDTTPIVPLGVLATSADTVPVACGTPSFLFYTKDGSISLRGGLRIIPLNIQPGDRVQEMRQYISDGYFGGNVTVGTAYREFPITPARGPLLDEEEEERGASLNLKRAINTRFNPRRGSRPPDLDTRGNLSFTTISPGYNEGEPRRGNGRRILILPVVTGGSAGYTVVSFAAFFLRDLATLGGTLSNPLYQIPVELICNYAVPSGTIDGPPLAGPPFQQLTRLQLTH